MATGFWHGADWNFILWGLFFAFFLILEKLFLLKYLKKLKGINHIYVLLLSLISFILFDNTDLGNAVSYIGGLFGAQSIPLITTETIYYLASYGVILIVAIVGCTPLPKYCYQKSCETKFGRGMCAILEPLVILATLAVCTAFLIDGSFNPFLYFRF
jgi:alginate O-acetyltransferase complex protein AlgI